MLIIILSCKGKRDLSKSDSRGVQSCNKNPRTCHTGNWLGTLFQVSLIQMCLFIFDAFMYIFWSCVHRWWMFWTFNWAKKGSWLLDAARKEGVTPYWPLLVTLTNVTKQWKQNNAHYYLIKVWSVLHQLWATCAQSWCKWCWS